MLSCIYIVHTETLSKTDIFRYFMRNIVSITHAVEGPGNHGDVMFLNANR